MMISNIQCQIIIITNIFHDGYDDDIDNIPPELPNDKIINNSCGLIHIIK